MRLITIWIIGNIGLLLFGCGEERILVKFLETLTGEPPPAHLLTKPKLP